MIFSDEEREQREIVRMQHMDAREEQAVLKHEEKRFEAACAAMQGIVAGSKHLFDVSVVARDAVFLADALLQA